MALAKITGNGIDVFFEHVNDEEYSRENTITQRAIESESNVSDHVNAKNGMFNVNGRFVNKTTAPTDLDTLRRFTDNKDLLQYIGRNVVSNLIIRSFKSSHVIQNRFGFDFTMQCETIRFAQKQTVLLNIDPNLITIPEVKKKTSSGTTGTNLSLLEGLTELIQGQIDKYNGDPVGTTRPGGLEPIQ